MNARSFAQSHAPDAEVNFVQRVLIVDDHSTGRLILSEIVAGIAPDIEIHPYDNAQTALEASRETTFDLVITDYRMPGFNGLNLIAALRERPEYHDVPILCVTVANDRELRYRALTLGATDVIGRPVDRLECAARCRNLLALRRAPGRRAASRERFFADGTFDVLSRISAISKHGALDSGTSIFQQAKIAGSICAHMGINGVRRSEIEDATITHDIGLIGIARYITTKTSQLTRQERAILRTHTMIGNNLLRACAPLVSLPCAVVALHHHERYDGRGYPFGLEGEDIPLEARIAAVADVFSAMISPRPYRARLSIDEAFDAIEHERARQFDPVVLDAFGAAREEIRDLVFRAQENLPVPYST